MKSKPAEIKKDKPVNSKVESSATPAIKPRWIPPNAGKGRAKGSLNKATAEIRGAIAEALQNSSGMLLEWLDDIAKTDKAKAIECYCKLAAFVLPKQIVDDSDQPKNGGTTNISFNFVSVSSEKRQNEKILGGETVKVIDGQYQS